MAGRSSRRKQPTSSQAIDLEHPSEESKLPRRTGVYISRRRATTSKSVTLPDILGAAETGRMGRKRGRALAKSAATFSARQRTAAVSVPRAEHVKSR
jgi:hypothetical protein